MTQPIFIIGFMGAGKTHTALKLANELGVAHIDSDAEIETMEEMSISEIFDRYGESYFRYREKSWLDNLAISAAVISCGGGLPCYHDNILTLKRKGIVIYLHTTVETILKRLKNDLNRPLNRGKTEAEIIQLKTKRELYYQMANILIQDAHDILKIKSMIAKHLS